MASVDPVVLAVGTVREVINNEFINRETGLIEDRGRKITILTRVGFLQFNIGVAFSAVFFEVGAPAVVWVKLKQWSFNGREGVTLIFDSVADADLVEAVAGYVA